jgi:DNA polymerase (family 10)
VDIEAILKACAKHGVAVEINANPWRLDLDWRWHRRTLTLGCTMCINSDAFDPRARSDSLGCLNGTQGRCP